MVLPLINVVVVAVDKHMTNIGKATFLYFFSYPVTSAGPCRELFAVSRSFIISTQFYSE